MSDKNLPQDDATAVSRRSFLGGVSGVTVASMTVGAAGLRPLLHDPTSQALAHEIGPGDPSGRAEQAKAIKKAAADAEKALGIFPHPCNGDEELYPTRIGNFTKTMRHNEFGEVNQADYELLLQALEAADFDLMDSVPQGGTGRFSNPLGGWVFNLEGPDPAATELPVTPPAFASQAMAAQAAEIYWMAVCRDVPFEDYSTNTLIAEAAADLNSFPGYMGPVPVTPDNIFRYDYPGALSGPMVSQLLLREFTYDGIPIDGKTRVPRLVNGGDGIEFLTRFPEWLDRQRGVAVPAGDAFEERFEQDPVTGALVLMYPRNVRDLGRIASQDTIFSTYFRAMRILTGFPEILDAGNPYIDAIRQTGTVTFGGIHLPLLVGSVHKAERHTWYDKWFVHRYLRPEAFGGRVHLTKTGERLYPIDPQLLSSPVLDHIFEQNRLNNQRRFNLDEGSYLLPQQGAGGSPSHPSAPAGHAVSAGACVTALKAWFNEDAPWPLPHYEPTAEGGRREVPGGIPGLTIGGELNKLAHNMSAGRDMLGVHWRVADNLTGNFQGEEITRRILTEARVRGTFPESHFTGFSLTKFNGETITV